MKKFNYPLWIGLNLLAAIFGVLYSKGYNDTIVLALSLITAIWSNGYLLLNFISRMRYLAREAKKQSNE